MEGFSGHFGRFDLCRSADQEILYSWWLALATNPGTAPFQIKDRISPLLKGTVSMKRRKKQILDLTDPPPVIGKWCMIFPDLLNSRLKVPGFR